MIFYEEYARAGGPGRMGHIGEGLIGPTLVAMGSPEQQQRFLPGILRARSSGARATPSRARAPTAGSRPAPNSTRAARTG